MKKNISKLLLLVFLGGLSLNAVSANNTGQVLRIFANGDIINFRLKLDTCNNVDENEYYQINMVTQSPSAEIWATMLLAASVTGKEVVVVVNDCDVVGNKVINYMYQDF